MLSITIPSDHQIDYFSTRPSQYDHFSTETPLASPETILEDTAAIPTNPLIARRGSLGILPSSASITTPPTLLQMQTDAATVRRPDPTPVQNVLHTTSDDSERSADSSSSGTRMSSIELARCSRCHRTPSIDVKTGKNNMIQYGLNLWYCTRCASMVGLANG